MVAQDIIPPIAIAPVVDEPLPILNRPATIIACTLVFQVIAAVSVGLRLLARFKLIDGLGPDDVFVVVALMSTIVGTVFVCLLPGAGLGRHIGTLSYLQLKDYLLYTWCNLLTQPVSASTIKISILLQYIRLTRRHNHVLFRRISKGLVVVCALWGLGYLFFNMFICIPVYGFWRPLETRSKCVLYSTWDGAKFRYIPFAASNTTLDLIIFMLPLLLLKSVQLSRKTVLGLCAVFSLGAIVVAVSALRLESMISTRVGLKPTGADPTWYGTGTLVYGMLEINIAVLTASIPIFWPMLKELSISRITVVNEISVSSEPMPHGMRSGKRSEDEVELTWQPDHLNFEGKLGKARYANKG